MSEVRVTPLDGETFGVEVDEGPTTTGHRVTVPADLLDRWAANGIDPAHGVEESVLFLLDRQPATAIPPEVFLDEVVRTFDDFDEEMTSRLSS